MRTCKLLTTLLCLTICLTSGCVNVPGDSSEYAVENTSGQIGNSSPGTDLNENTELAETGVDTSNFSNTNYVFQIDDSCENAVSLIGKYVFIENPEVFFEINENEAVLHYAFANYAGFYKEESESQIVKIYEVNDVICIDFLYAVKGANYNYIVRFYSQGDAFAWDDETTTHLLYKQ